MFFQRICVLTVALLLGILEPLSVKAFTPLVHHQSHGNHPSCAILRMTETAASSTTAFANTLQDNLVLLKRAAETKQEDPDAVIEALLELEKQMRQQAKEDYPATAEQTLENLNGDWRLIFTTGTMETQKRTGRINYFPLKAIQSFRPSTKQIENGIYVGDWNLIKFAGTFDFNLKSRKLEFDFNKVQLFSFLDVQLGKGDAAQLGAKTGLGSENNVGKDRKAFFNWISADADIATARGAGGGLALWKRIG